ncbi:FHA domain-containing protein [Salinibacterium sp. SYSU T00001]|uniref:FHA domain-containing protein n=1 Tax=Homoserinimonas sedimenticola TaxID=2986805 RepID=UPI002235EFAF|nr:FHA domain-containing protein [Salinibacterium sedimenticola]MCW4384924.1 FHA domain-containing protein [Salinibacterium sedimenticola]
MREHWYQPGTDGSWVALSTGDVVLAVEAGQSIQELWEALPSGFQAVLDVLTARGLSATPSFALLSWSPGDELRAIVRGPVQLTVSSGDSDDLLDGTGVSTWTEKLFAAGSAFRLALPASPLAPALPLAAGAVMAAHVASAPGPAAVSVTAAVSPLPEATVTDVSDATAREIDAPVESAAAPVDDGYDYLFGATMYRSVSEAAVGNPEEQPDGASHESTATAAAEEGDHDGMTIMTGDLRRLRAERRASAAVGKASERPASTLRLELSNGSVEVLDQTLIVGRSPSASKVSGGAIPRLITIPGDKDISRNHAQFTVEGGTVVVTDLHSRNGTQIVLPGRPPQQLRQGEPTTIIPGTMVDLGGGVTLTVREGE